MSRVEDYLAISPGYCRSLGGLRWCSDGGAVEYEWDDAPEIGMTFAMSDEIVLFLEGFQTGAQPISFSFVLHLLHFLGFGTKRPEPESLRRAVALEKAFQETGKQIRNAGALCAMLCRGVPREPGAPAIPEVCLALNRPVSRPLGDQLLHDLERRRDEVGRNPEEPDRDVPKHQQHHDEQERPQCRRKQDVAKHRQDVG